MTFFPLSLKALAIAIAALAGVAVALTRSKSIDSAALTVIGRRAEKGIGRIDLYQRP
jgi:hypothetical protein